MKQLKDSVILYDADCPMCKAYTGGFVRSGMLDKEGRLPYQNLPAHIADQVDQARYTTEIALLNTKSGHVTYGVQSLFAIISNSLPVFKPLFSCRPFAVVADVMYKFVSYNRRVIVPPVITNASTDYFAPKLHVGYRVVYLIFTWLVTSLLLHRFNQNLTAYLPAGTVLRELTVCGGQMIWQAALMILMNRKQTWEYLGNMMTISLAGGVLLNIIAVMAGLAGITAPWFYLSVFALIVLVMFLEHLRRCRLLDLGIAVTASWVLYRLFVLLILL